MMKNISEGATLAHMFSCRHARVYLDFPTLGARLQKPRQGDMITGIVIRSIQWRKEKTRRKKRRVAVEIWSRYQGSVAMSFPHCG